ncbi:MAG: TIGR00725 family protein [Thermoplasmata archaeon]|nr:TIGR00725 family protein [Candidatus Sysuiplasma acidicola]MBX8646469.1 TIGR00725 family protein [Candidatus Sysuiplasma acidicola]MDH2904861.1 TIGR00725 family protein [Methanomassiliicoccales archaeon]
MKVPYNIAIIGGSQADKRHLKLAYTVGKLLAARSAIIICGGLTGVMESAAKGVKSRGGISVGILPGGNLVEANPFLTVRLPTGIGYARNFLIVRASEAVIAIDGSSGTISEASFALTEGKSVISLDSFRLATLKDGDGKFIVAESAKDAVELAISAASKYRRSHAQ